MITDIHAHYLPVDAMQDSAFRLHASSGLNDSITIQVNESTMTLPGAVCDPHRLAANAVERGIGRRVLSLPPFAVRYELPPEAGLQWSRRANDALAQAVAMQPDVLAAFANVPLQCGGAVAAEELRRAVGVLGLRGVEILTSVRGDPVDTPELEEFWTTATDLDVPVLIHPHFVSGAERMSRFHLRNVFGNPIEVALTAAQLLLGGLIDSHPSLKVILAHGGGALPAIVGRLQHAYTRRPEYRHVATEPREGVKRLYYDTIVFDTRMLRFMGDIVGIDRLVLGSDFPFDMGEDDPVAFVSNADMSPQATTAVLHCGSTLIPALK